MNEHEYMDQQRAHDAHYGLTIPGLPGKYFPALDAGTWFSDPRFEISDGERALLDEVQRLRHLLRWEQVKDTYEAPNRRITVEFKPDQASMTKAIRQWLDSLGEPGDNPDGK